MKEEKTASAKERRLSRAEIRNHNKILAVQHAGVLARAEIILVSSSLVKVHIYLCL